VKSKAPLSARVAAAYSLCTAMATATHCAYCFDVLLDSLNGNDGKHVVVPENKADTRYPLFVTWTKRKGEAKDYTLRGCIGTFSPQELNQGLKDYAITSAFKDSRFQPMKGSEVPHLSCGVSLLTNFEVAKHAEDWTVGTHGITIEFVCPVKNKTYSATYLPEVAEEQGWTKHKTLTELVAKTGYTRPFTKEIKELLKVTRYQSSKASLTYDEYVKLRQATKNAILTAKN